MNVVKGPALGFVPDDKLVPIRYQSTFNLQSLGSLYAKLYALEFANKVTETDRSNANGNKRSKINLANKVEPELAHEPGDDVTADSSSANGSGGSHHPVCHAEMRQAFESYFISLHAELRMLLEKVVDHATAAVGSGSQEQVMNLQRAYHDFTEALSVHAYVEEHVLFQAFSHLRESYNFEHRKEHDRIQEISNIMRNLDSSSLAEVFLKITQLAAVHNVQMEKEEEYYWPILLRNLDDSQIASLISKSKSHIAKARVNLNNSRHKAAIDQARMAVGLPAIDEEEPPAPSLVDEHPHFSRDDEDPALNLIQSMF